MDISLSDIGAHSPVWPWGHSPGPACVAQAEPGRVAGEFGVPGGAVRWDHVHVGICVLGIM